MPATGILHNVLMAACGVVFKLMYLCVVASSFAMDVNRKHKKRRGSLR